jgi:hypothetical protein
MKHFTIGQKVRINAEGVNSKFGIIADQFEGYDAWFVKVGVTDDRRAAIWDIKDCILLGGCYLEAIN